ncbi:hypothetical protein CSC75_10730 [Pseudoxanthomonas wuyuanensis]|nr:hypothetical protein CSC75_10730 [Pseudoxanthomonas wuyuanensis]
MATGLESAARRRAGAAIFTLQAPAECQKKLSQPFIQGGCDSSRLGPGPSIARRSVQANAGIRRVGNLPGAGCAFTIDLPRRWLPADSPVSGTA